MNNGTRVPPRSLWHVARIVAATAAVAAAVAAAVGVAFVYLGVYNVAADVPHTRPMYWLMEAARDRSVAVRARDVRVPTDLDDPHRISVGAGLYDNMCSNCHLGPGMEETEISRGLYPRAPDLARSDDLSPAEAFWITKHGFKMTGMAAWGNTHSDTLIWDMVAFLRAFPAMNAAQYQAAVKSAPADHDAMMHDMMGSGTPMQQKMPMQQK